MMKSRNRQMSLSANFFLILLNASFFLKNKTKQRRSTMTSLDVSNTRSSLCRDVRLFFSNQLCMDDDLDSSIRNVRWVGRCCSTTSVASGARDARARCFFGLQRFRLNNGPRVRWSDVSRDLYSEVCRGDDGRDKRQSLMFIFPVWKRVGGAK